VGRGWEEADLKEREVSIILAMTCLGPISLLNCVFCSRLGQVGAGHASHGQGRAGHEMQRTCVHLMMFHAAGALWAVGGTLRGPMGARRGQVDDNGQ
jgi:hypothetical protein